MLKYEIIMDYNNMIEDNYKQAGYFKSKEQFIDDFEQIKKLICEQETIEDIRVMRIKIKIAKLDEQERITQWSVIRWKRIKIISE